MKKVFGVFFRPDAPVELRFLKMQLIKTPLGESQTIRCSEVRETSYGFLELVPMLEDGIQPPSLLVPAGYIQYMLRGTGETPMGFLTQPGGG